MDGRRQRILIGKRRKTSLWWSSSTMRMNLLLITVVASSAAEGRKDRTRPLPVYDSLPPILLPSFINQRPRAQSFNPSIQVGKRALLLLPFHFLCLPFSFLFSPKSTPSPSSSPFYPHSSEQRSLGASDVGGRPQKGKAKERVWPNG